MGARGPKPSYDVGAFVVDFQLGASRSLLAERYGITLKGVERRIHRLRVLGTLPPAPGQSRPDAAAAAERERRENERRRVQLERDRRAQVRRQAALDRQVREQLEQQERERAERAEQMRLAVLADERAQVEAWHRERRQAEANGTAPVLDLFG